MAKQIYLDDDRLPVSVIMGAAKYAREQDIVFSQEGHCLAAARYSAPTSGVAARRQHDRHYYIYNSDVEDAARQVVSNDFERLRRQWIDERGATSSITEMAMSRPHLQIIGLGPAVIPHILRQMENEGNEPDMWFVALQMLTRADPVTDDIRGDFVAMAHRWLHWAAVNGYAW